MNFLDRFAPPAQSHDTTHEPITRRSFLRASAALGGGLLLGLYGPSTKAASKESATTADMTAASPKPPPPFAFVRIAPDESVTVYVNKLEFGQGIRTALPMLIAEELDCDWSQVRSEFAPIEPLYANPFLGTQITGGSTSVATSWQPYLRIGATARAMLIAAAAHQWQTDAAQLRTESGFVIGPNGKKASYGSLAEAAARIPVPDKVALKPVAQRRLIGTPVKHLEAATRVDGSARFGMDQYLDGMKTALIAFPPTFGGKVKRVDDTKARAIPGVLDVVQVPADQGGTAIAVIATGYWPAKSGRDALGIEWETGPAPVDTEEQFKRYHALAATPGLVAGKIGDVASARPAKTLSAQFEFPYLAHAPMEPLNWVIDLKPDHCDIWTASQMPDVDLRAAAQAAGLKPDQVKLHNLPAGGGFGKRAIIGHGPIIEAVHVAKAAKAPVKIVWSREDETRRGYYRPMHVHHADIGLDANGRIVSWRHTIVGQSIVKGSMFAMLIKDGVDPTSTEGVANLAYSTPNLLAMLHSPDLNVPPLWWRSVGHTHTGYAVETLMDDLAALAGQDPVQFRLAHLDGKHQRHIDTLKLVAEKSAWGKPLPQGHAHGVALHESFGTVVAQVAEVSIDNGTIRVHKVTAAAHCGTVVNPLNAEAQIQSGIVFGLSAALYGNITLKNGVVEQSNFHDYPVLRMNEMPLIAVHFVPSQDPPSGLGEPGTPPIAPAVSNALRALTGKRLRKLPFNLAA